MKSWLFSATTGMALGLLLAAAVIKAFELSALYSPIVEWSLDGRFYNERLYYYVYLTDWLMLFAIYSLFVVIGVKVLNNKSWIFYISLQVPQFVISFHFLVELFLNGHGMKNVNWLALNCLLQMTGIIFIFSTYLIVKRINIKSKFGTT